MKSKERVKKLRDMPAEELRQQIAELSEQDFKYRFQWTMGQTEMLKKMRELRKDRARVLTVLNEKSSKRS